MTKDQLNHSFQTIISKSIKLAKEIKELKKHPNITPAILKKLEKIENELI